MEERGMGDFLTYKLYLTGWDQSHVRVWISHQPTPPSDQSPQQQFDVISSQAQWGFFFSLPPQATHVMVHFDKDTDVVTGLKQKTHYGRPIWDKEFEQVRKENPT